MKKLWKTTFREITGSFGRYVAILLIVTLGVGFFSGLKTAKPTMYRIVNEYVTDYRLFDYRILTTLGMESEDVEAARELAHVTAAEGSVNFDALMLLEGDESDGEKVIHVQSLTEEINLARLMSGRMPESSNEVVADALRFSKEDIGKQLFISGDNEEDTLDLMEYDSYVIVGLMTSPYYMNFERGNASIGNGTVAGYVYMPMEGISSDYYTELFIKTDSRGGIHSDEYKAETEQLEAEMEAFAERVALRRENSIRAEADDKIREAEQKLSDAKKELEDGEEELSDGHIKLEEAKQEVSDGWEQLEDGKKQLEEGKKALKNSKMQLQDAAAELEKGWALYQSGLEKLDAGRLKLDEAQAALEQMKAFMTPEQYEASQLQLDAQRSELLTNEAALKASKSQLDQGQAEYDSGVQKLKQGERDLADAESEIETNRQKLLDAEEEISENEQKLLDGEKDLEDGRTKIEEAETELTDAKDKLADMDETKWYALGRDTNVGYVCFESDSNIVEQVSQVFPIFFFLVAALVCMTTMNRMIEEQRTQIGVMKALGYGSGRVMQKYMIYSGSAALIGGLIGFFIGSFLFPRVIWIAYGMIYSVGGEAFVIVPQLGVITIAVALVCCMGTTYLTLRGVLRVVPASLLRPKAPQSGKKIWLERIPLLWKRFSFMHKVSSRNIFRYKKRLFMMVVGISGCTALLITGMGLYDSIVGVVPEQYGNIQKYDAAITLKDELSDEAYRSFLGDYGQGIESETRIASISADLSQNGKTKTFQLILPKDADTFCEYVNLYDAKGRSIPYPKVGEAVMTDKAARKLGIQTGDEVSFLDDDLNEITVTISGICVNYVSDFIYSTVETYQKQGGKPSYKTIWCRFKEGEDPHLVGAQITGSDDVVAVSLTEDLKARVDSMMESLIYVILLVVVSAALLAFIVLYNLTNINITERIREIATIKVLGFTPRETAMYVFRENLVLTAFGAIAGIFLGWWFHGFVMDCIDVDGIAFQNAIFLRSYIIGIVLTFLFSIFVDICMYGKLERIDMAESLKSIE